MIPIDNRSKKILTFLVDSHLSLSISKLAEKLNITNKMILDRLPFLDSWLQPIGASINRKPGIGIRLDASPEILKKIRMKIGEIHNLYPLLTREERRKSLLFILLTAFDPLAIKQLQLKLCVSKATILNDIENIKPIIVQKTLRLVSKQNYGLIIEGSEEIRRDVIVGYILDSCDRIKLIKLCSGNNIDQCNLDSEGFNIFLREYICELDFKWMNQIIERIESQFNSRFVDDDRVKLELYLAITLDRNRNGRFIETTPENITSINGLPELEISEFISRCLNEKVSDSLNKNEILHLTNYLLSCELSNADNSQKLWPWEFNSMIPDMVDELINQASLHLHPSMGVDPDLRNSLSYYLVRTIPKLKAGVYTQNPLLAEVRNLYPDVFGFSNDCCQKITNRFGIFIPEDDKGYLAMCFVVSLQRMSVKRKIIRLLIVCNAGKITKWLLTSRIRAEFPEIEIVDTLSVLEFMNYENFEFVDCILSTIPLEVNAVPVIVVDPTLNEKDVQTIKDIAMRLTERKFRSTSDLSQEILYQPLLSELLTVETIEIGIDTDQWKDAVCQAGKILVRAGAIDNPFIDDMISLIDKYGPYMVVFPGVALLHAGSVDQVKKLGIGLAVFSKPIFFGHSVNDPVRIAFVIAAIDDQSHLRALNELVNIMTSEKNRQKIASTTSKEQIIQMVKSYCINLRTTN